MTDDEEHDEWDQCRECDTETDEECSACGWPLCDDCVEEYDGENRLCWRCADD